MKASRVVSAVLLLATFAASAAEPPPEAAAKYYAVLLKRPHQDTLFDRFEGAWLDERPAAGLREFLEAEVGAGRDGAAVLLARFHLRRGTDGPALAALATAIERAPEDGRLRIERARVNLRRLEFEAAADDLRSAFASEDEVVALQAGRELGKVLLRAGRRDEAAAAWDAALEAHPGDTDLLEDLVDLAAAEGEVDAALGYLDRLDRLTDDPYRKALQSLRRGDLLASAGRSDAALATYGRTLDGVGQDSWLEREILAQIENLFRRDGRVVDLRAHFAGLAEKHPGRLAIHLRVAKLDAEANRIDAAVGRFREVLKRSPGERELRQEFIRMLAAGERLEEAVGELERLIGQFPGEAELWLQMAALRERQERPQEALSALREAHELLGEGEAVALRIAGLMLEYRLEDEGVALLRERLAADGASAAPAEALAAYLSREGRRAEALELLEGLCGSEELDTVLRAQAAIAGMGEAGAAFERLSARSDDFGNDARFLGALVRSGLAAKRAGELGDAPLRLVRMARGAGELGEAVRIAARALVAAEAAAATIERLEREPGRELAMTCLLAELEELGGDFPAVDALFEGVEDPLAVRFYAALLVRRGEVERAVAAMERLAEGEEGRRAGYLKELSELQARAGRLEEALATIDRWKQAAPGDRVAWVQRSELLRELGRLDEAMRELRQAVARFEGDKDLSVRLAGLHQERGESGEAEAIYWRLYDESESALEQARWAGELAKLARESGRTAELEERLVARSRANRRSIGPLLARAELARVMDDAGKRRDLLLEAVRLQPRDLELRLRIARLEEDAGEPERAVAVLEEALEFDTDHKVRRALATAYLRLGEVEKALGQLRAMRRGGDADPQELVRIATSLGENGLHEEAVRMLAEERRRQDDWRLASLQAVLMIEDGREAEALPVLVDLLEAETSEDRSGLQSPWLTRFEGFPGEVRPLAMFLNATQTRQRMRMGGQMGGGGPAVPQSLEEARSLALLLLFDLEDRLEDQNAVAAAIRSTGIGEVEMYRRVAGLEDFNQLWEVLLKDFPENRAVLAMGISFYPWLGERHPFSDEQLEIVFAMEGLAPWYRLTAATELIARHPGEEKWVAKLLELGEDESAELRDPMASALIEVIGNEDLADASAGRVRARLEGLLDAKNGDGEPLIDGAERLKVERQLRSDFSLVEFLNEACRRERGRIAQGNAASGSPAIGQLQRHGLTMAQYRQVLGQQWGQMIMSPAAIPLRTVPGWVVASLPDPAGEVGMNRFFRGLGLPGDEESPFELGELEGKLDELESPVLRALVAWAAGDDERLASALEAPVEGVEAADLRLIRIGRELRHEEPDEEALFGWLFEARRDPAVSRELTEYFDQKILELAGGLPEGVRGEREAELKTILWRSRGTHGAGSAAELARIAAELGFEGLARRLQPRASSSAGGSNLGPAAIRGVARSPGVAGSAPQPVERIGTRVAEGKPEAAAREALAQLRAQRRQSIWGNDHREPLLRALDDAGREALLELTDPGTSRSRVKRLDFAELCSLAGEEERAYRVLEELFEDRPRDVEVAARLAFSPTIDQKRAAELLTLASAAGSELAAVAVERIQRVVYQEDAETCLRVFGRIAAWLESRETGDDDNLSWVAYFGKEFFGWLHSAKLPSLLPNEGPEREAGEHGERREEIARQLALAMMREPGTAEPGFRLLSAWGGSGLDEAKLDQLARRAMLASAESGHEPFALVTRMGRSVSGEQLERWSSWSHIGERLSEGVSPATLMPPDFLAELKGRDARLGALAVMLSQVADAEDVRDFLESDELAMLGNEARAGMTQVLMQRAAGIEGIGVILREQLAAMPEVEQLYGSGDAFGPIVRAVMAALGEDAAALDETLTLAAEKTFGGKPDFKQAGQQAMMSYSMVNRLHQALWSLAIEPADEVRLRASMYRTGFPVTVMEHEIDKPFGELEFGDGAEAIAFLEAAGLLAGADAWTPPGGLVVEADHGPAGMSVRILDRPRLEEALGEIEWSERDARAELVTRLEELERPSFGSRMVLAAMSSGELRERRTLEALKADAGALAELPDEAWQRLRFVAGWLSPEVREAVPAALRERFEEGMDGPAAGELAEFLAQGRRALEAAKRTGTPAFDAVEPFLPELLKLSPGDAVELFVEAEDQFTISLQRGGRFSRNTSNGYEIARRDEVLLSLLREVRVDQASADRRAEFLRGLFESPAAARLSWADDGYRGLIEGAFEDVHEAQVDKSKGSNGGLYPDRYTKGVAAEIKRVEPENQPLVALACFTRLMRQTGWLEGRFTPRVRKELEAQGDGPWQEIGWALVGSLAWAEDDDERRAESAARMAAVLRNEELPLVLRTELVVRILTTRPSRWAGRSDKVIGRRIFSSPEVMAAAIDLGEAYFIDERSSVNLWGECFLDLLTDPGMPEGSREAAAELVGRIWGNSQQRNAAGHSPIPPAFATNAFVAAVNTGNPASERILPQVRSGIVGDYFLLMRLVSAGSFEMAAELLPPGDEAFGPWNSNHSWTREVDEGADRFIAYLEKEKQAPDQALKFLAQSLFFPEVRGAGGPRRRTRERAVEVARRYFELESKTERLRFNVLRRLIRHLPEDERLTEETLAITKDLDYAGELRRTLTLWGAPAGTQHQDWEEARCKAEVFDFAALRAVGRGEPERLQTSLKGMEQASRLTDEHYNLRTFFDVFIYRSLPQVCAMAIHGDREAMSEAAPLFAGFAEFAAPIRSFNDYRAVRMPLEMGRMLWTCAGQGERYKEFVEGAHPRVRKQHRESVKFPPFVNFGWFGVDLFPWAQEGLEGQRAALIRTLLASPEGSELIPVNGRWTHFLKNSHMEEVMNHVLENPPDVIQPRARPMIEVLGARRYRWGNEKEKGIPHMRRAIEAIEGREHQEVFRGSLKIELAEFLEAVGRHEEGLEVIEGMSAKEIERHAQKRDRVLKKLKQGAE